MEGKKQIIDIHDICGISANRGSYGNTFLKYYIEVFNRELYRKYLYQMDLPQSIRDKEIIAEYEQYGKINHRIMLKFDDSNALENMSIIVGK